MDFEDHFTSHSYRNLYWTAFESFINKELPSPECYPAKKTDPDAADLKLPESKLPLRDTSQPQRMIIAARCPTGAPPELQVGELWRGWERADIADEEKEKDVIFGTITEWLSRSDGNPFLPNDILLLRLPPTYEVELISLSKYYFYQTFKRSVKSTAAAPATPDVSMDGTDAPSLPDVDAPMIGSGTNKGQIRITADPV
ncbi:hypothetical protein K438DRAFT_1776101 [Mycena galopus ATCC 62051]|nr:hypothetical protein K438DRAFT_1776101 [Mycena galopus ATCC 62051]